MQDTCRMAEIRTVIEFSFLSGPAGTATIYRPGMLHSDPVGLHRVDYDDRHAERLPLRHADHRGTDLRDAAGWGGRWARVPLTQIARTTTAVIARESAKACTHLVRQNDSVERFGLPQGWRRVILCRTLWIFRSVAMLHNGSLGRFGDRRLDKGGRRCSNAWSRAKAPASAG